MRDSRSARFRSLFVHDKEAFWWDEYNDYERKLAKMNLSELAGELDRTKVRNETANTIIVEHLLAIRLARIQSRASFGAAWIGIVGAVVAAYFTFYLGQQSVTPKAECSAVSGAASKR